MFSETIELRGHIIDSLILPKVLDQILTRGANFKIAEIKIGQKRADQSFARIEVSAESSEALDELVLRLRQHGAEVVERANVQLGQSPADGVFPDDFYVTTNQQTFVRLDGKEIEVHPAMMDSAIAVDRQRTDGARGEIFRCEQRRRNCGRPQGRPGRRRCSDRLRTPTCFNSSTPMIGADEPKSAVIRELANELRRARDGRRQNRGRRRPGRGADRRGRTSASV